MIEYRHAPASAYAGATSFPGKVLAGSIMDVGEVYSYLMRMRTSALRAECARDAIRRAEYELTRIPSLRTDGTRAARSTNYDSIAMRVHALESIRKRRGRELHDSVAALKDFRLKLAASELGDDEQRIVWMKSVLGMNTKAIARALHMDIRHVWPMLKAAYAVLAESLETKTRESSGTNDE